MVTWANAVGRMRDAQSPLGREVDRRSLICGTDRAPADARTNAMCNHLRGAGRRPVLTAEAVTEKGRRWMLG